MKAIPSSLIRIVLSATLVISAMACSSGRSSEFELNREDYAVASEREHTSETVYLEGTVPIDQVSPTTLRADVWKVDDTNYPDSVHAFVRVLDSQNNFVTRMGPPHFQGPDAYKTHWRKVREELSYFEAYSSIHDINDFVVREYSDGDSIPFAVSLVLDHGGSMGGTIDALIEGAEIFVEMKRSYDRMALLTFSNTPDIIAELTSSREVLLGALDEKAGLDEYGKYTAMYDAAMVGVKQLVNQPAGSPRVLVLFSDGEDNYSEADVQAVYELAIENDVSIYPIGFGYTNDDVLGELARKTAGKFYKAYSREELVAIFRDLYLSLRNYYRVSYVPPAKPMLHEITVTIDAPGRDIPMLAQGEYDRTIGDEIAQTIIRRERSQETLDRIKRESERAAIAAADMINRGLDPYGDPDGKKPGGDDPDGKKPGGDSDGKKPGDDSDGKKPGGDPDGKKPGDDDQDGKKPEDNDYRDIETSMTDQIDQIKESGESSTFDLPDTLFFDVGEVKLRSTSYGVLRSIAKSLKSNKGVRINIIGHTDNTWLAAESPEQIEQLNLMLSRRRAKAVEGFLVKEGVSRERLKSLGRGLSRPVASNDTEEGRARNRRVEFVIIRQ